MLTVEPTGPDVYVYVLVAVEEQEIAVRVPLGARLETRVRGFIADEIDGYDYFGWGDLDVVHGDFRAFYGDEVLTHYVICSNYFM